MMIDCADSIQEIVSSLDKEELTYFLRKYNTYILEFFEEHDYESQPVGMLEFYNNDFQQDLFYNGITF